jgi:hypothetical protein
VSVEVVREGAPARPVRNAGQISARCVGDAATDEARCLRVLQEQACQLGAEVIWDMRSSPLGEEGRELRAAAGVYQSPR